MLTLPSLSPVLAQAADQWTNVFFGLDGEQRFVLMIVAIGCLTGVICTIVGCLSGAITSYHRHQADLELKRELLDRGMSAEEIARVVEASPPKDFLERWALCRPRKKTG